ncbi:MAG: hypothetical protein WBA25_11060 [Jannaschia sp.]
MTARGVQSALAAIFVLLGGWCMLLPGMVVGLVFLPGLDADGVPVRFVMGCFGAQAVLTGTILATARFTPTTFLVFGLAGSLPFFAFNVWFTLVEPVLNGWMWLDVLGNAGILACGLLGHYLARREGAAS